MRGLTWLFSLAIVLAMVNALSVSASENSALDEQPQTIPVSSNDGGSGTGARRPAVGLRFDVIRVITAEDILRLPTRGHTEIAGLQPGAMQLPGLTNTHNGPVSVRTSLPSEVVYFVDGISRRDYGSGQSVTFLNNNLIDQITMANNAFDASYAQASSGVVNVTTKSGTRELHGAIEAVTDNFHGDNYDYNSYSATLTGPLAPRTDKLTFAATLERGWYGDAEPHSRAGGMLAHQSSGLWDWYGKLNWKPVTNLAVNAGVSGSDLDAKLFSMPFYFNAEHAPRTTEKTNSAWLTLNHSLSEKTSYTITGNWFSNKTETGDGVYFDNIRAYGRPDGNFYTDNTHLFYSGDNPNTPSGRDHEVKIDPTYGYGYITVDGQDIVIQDERGFVRKGRSRESVNFYIEQGWNPWDSELILRDEDGVIYADEGWVYEDYQKRQSSYSGFRADIVHELFENHKVNAGGDFQYHTLRYYRHYFPHNNWKDWQQDGVWEDNGGYIDVDHYGYDIFGNESDTLSEGTEARHPYNLSFYVQDKISVHQAVFNIGLRYDYYQANTKRLRWPETPLGDMDDGIGDDSELNPTDFEDSKANTYFSPRLSMALQPHDGSVLHLSYGRFLQQPDLSTLYSGWDFMQYSLTQAGYLAPLGNPNLEPSQTKVIELGFSQQITNTIDIDLTGFYREVQGITQMTYFRVQPGAAGRDFYMYTNSDEVTIKGLEAQINFKRFNIFAAQLNYAYTATDAEGPFSLVSRNIAWTVSKTPVYKVPWILERTHNLTAILDARLGGDRGPKLGNVYPLERSGLNLVFRVGSGFPYWPFQTFNEVTLADVSPVPRGYFNSEHTPAIYRFDVKLDKQIPFAGTYVDFYLWVLNVFDRENVIDVYAGSGRPDDTGWLDTDSGHMFIQAFSEPDWTNLTGEQKYNLRQIDPYHYDTPRQIRFGARVSF